MADNAFGVDYEAVLADLRAKRDKLDAAIAGIETMLGISGNGSGSAGAKPNGDELPDSVEHDTFWRMSVPDATRKFLAMKKRPQSTKEIAAALEKGGVLHSSKDFPNTVGTVLTRIDQRGGDIVKLERGKFGLAEWYPNSKRRNKAPTKTLFNNGADAESEEDADYDDGSA